MGPHTDGGNGALLTLMLYLPRSEVWNAYGTEFFRKEGAKFEVVRKRRFAPNCAHAFAVNDDSWHGLSKPIPRWAESRRSFVVRYFQVNAC